MKLSLQLSRRKSFSGKNLFESLKIFNKDKGPAGGGGTDSLTKQKLLSEIFPPMKL